MGVTIITMCVDPERGKYKALAVSSVCGAAELNAVEESYTSREEAVGTLVWNNPGISVSTVIDLEKYEKEKKESQES